MKIIAFGNRRREGKRTAADFLFTAIKTLKPNLRCHLGGFADEVKRVSHDLYGWAGLHPGIWYENNGGKETILPALGVSARDIWIHVGESLRAICPTVWV